jgi:hypothetical protein
VARIRAVRKLVARPGFRRRATDLGTAITEAGGTRAATDLVEGLLS